jgi:hypothetical protein
MTGNPAGIEMTGNVRVVLNISFGRERKVAVNVKKKAGLNIRLTQESTNQAALVQYVLKKPPGCQNPIKPVVR